MVAREAVVEGSKDGAQGSGGRGFRCLCRPVSFFSRAAAAELFLPLVALVRATHGALPLMPDNLHTYNLSGSYSFHAPFAHPAVQAHGDLDLDWLGDLSGAGVTVSHDRAAKT